MAGPLVFLIPAGLLLLVGGAAAASKKKEKEQAAAASAAGAAANAASNTVTPGPGTTGAATTPSVKPPATGAGAVVAPVSVPGAGIAAQPVQDVQAMVLAALQSGNPATMLRVAAAIEATYPQAAAELKQAAANIQAVIAQQAAATTGPGPTSPGAAPAAVPTTTNVPTPAASAGMPSASMPTPQPSTSTADPNRARAGALLLALKTAKKGTASEPKALVKEFQLVERLPRQDGSYGSETGLALADRYNMIPPKPLYWGKKGGDYSTLTADKNQYSAHLLNLAAKDPQRADEWRSAAKV
jgi:hypothetical protein